MRISLFILGVCLLCSGGSDARSEDANNGIDANGVAWGQTVNGLQLGVSPQVKLSKTYEFEGFGEPFYERDTLQVTVHLRNVGKSDVRILPSVWDCLAMGDDGAIPVSKLVMKPEAGGDSLTVTYRGWNHLRLLDKRRSDSESWQQTLCKSVPGGEDLQLDEQDARDRQISLESGDAVWPEWVNIGSENGSHSLWRPTDESGGIAPGKYRVTAVLVIDQEKSDWKGELTSGTLDIEILARKRRPTR